MSIDYTPDEMMAVAAARLLRDGQTCLVGIGVPGTAACLAQATSAPNLTLIYESGCIGSRPRWIPLTVGDGELADTALTVVSVAEMFNYWIQPGRIDVAMVSGAQIDRFANLNTTAIGAYERPQTRLPGAGGAPEIVSACRDVLVILRQRRRSFVERLDFRTSVGFGEGPGTRRALGHRGAGPSAVITDLGILKPDPETCELMLTDLHTGVTLDDALASTEWSLPIAESVGTTAAPTIEELSALRRLQRLNASPAG